MSPIRCPGKDLAISVPDLVTSHADLITSKGGRSVKPSGASASVFEGVTSTADQFGLTLKWRASRSTSSAENSRLLAILCSGSGIFPRSQQVDDLVGFATQNSGNLAKQIVFFHIASL